MTEQELGPEPCVPNNGISTLSWRYRAALAAWTLWCAKCAVLRFSALTDSVEIWAFHVAAEEVRTQAGDDAATEFFMAAFPPNSEARAAAMRPLSPRHEDP
jgi:hypothetical protein